MVRSILWYGLLAVVVVALAAVAISWPRYRAAVEAGREVLAGGVIASTPRGDIQYAEAGGGPAVLVSHGAGGGYDQGLLLGRTFVGEGYRFIAPSRFGYLRSPVPEDSSPAAQADLYAALLDTLGLDKVAVVAVSDGGPPALQFALRHPDRITALVMIAGKSMTPPPSPALMEPAFNLVFRSDYLFWTITTAGRSALLTLFGVNAEVQRQATADAQGFVTGFLATLNPVSLREPGIANDRATMAFLPEAAFPLEDIAVPTLVIHAEDDGLQPYAHGLNSARRIAGAEFMSLESGGHMLLSQHDDVRRTVDAFLDRRAPTGAPAARP
jgi:pimeloyl-ACP methyl ester carboxylesterase